MDIWQRLDKQEVLNVSHSQTDKTYDLTFEFSLLFKAFKSTVEDSFPKGRKEILRHIFIFWIPFITEVVWSPNAATTYGTPGEIVWLQLGASTTETLLHCVSSESWEPRMLTSPTEAPKQLQVA